MYSNNACQKKNCFGISVRSRRSCLQSEKGGASWLKCFNLDWRLVTPSVIERCAGSRNAKLVLHFALVGGRGEGQLFQEEWYSPDKFWKSIIELVCTAHIPFIKSKPNKTLIVTCHMKNTDITAAIYWLTVECHLSLFIFQPVSLEVKTRWVKEIRNLLQSQFDQVKGVL